MSLTPNEGGQPYMHQAWPSWRYGPNGQSAVFNGPDEVPEGWGEIPPGTSTVEDEPVDEAPPAPPVEDHNDEDEGTDASDTTEAAAVAAAIASEPDTHELTEEEQAEARTAKVNALKDAHSQPELVAMIEAMKEIDPNIEFLVSWPKLKLATAIVDNGGPLED